MKRFKVFKKLCSLALILSMLVSIIPINVFAAPTIDGSRQTGSLTINKYDSIYDANKPETHKPINGVEFTIYKIYDLVLNDGVITYTPVAGLNDFLSGVNPELIAEKSEEDLKAFISSLKAKIETLNTDENKDNDIEKTSVETGTNGTDGQAVFSDLKLGYYLVDETAYPDQVVTPSDAFLVSIPMTNEAEDSWVYDIVANPKNDTALTEVTLTKYGNNNTKLQGAKFQLQKKVDNNWVNSTEEPIPTDSNGILRVESLTHGEYRFVETEAPDGYILDTTKTYEFKVVWNKESKRLEYVYNGVTSPSLNIEVLNEKPTIEKVADKLTAGLGEKVRWEITTTVPSLINELKTFTITDELSKGLKFKTDINLKVVQGKSEDGTDDELEGSKLNDFTSIEEFDFATDENKDVIYVWTVVDKKLVIKFNPKKLTPLTDIVVSYDTEITSDAVVIPSGNDNEATLEYSISTSPNSTETEKIRDEDVVYSFGLQVNKTASDKTTMLPGAKFTLCKKGTTECHEKVSGTNGIIKFPQLAAGEYVLTEIQAPNGYNLLKEPITIKMTALETEKGLETKVTAIINGEETELTNNKVINEATGEKNPYYELLVVNNKGFQLPTTGGMGTVIFTVVGLGMMGLAGAAYIALKRKESQQ